MTVVRSAARLTYTDATSAVVVQLARFEGLRMLRSPFTWIGSAGSAALMWYWLGGVAPLLQRDVIFLAGAMLPLAASTLLAANEATLRRRRTAETLTTLPRGESEPLWGIQCGVAGPVAVAIALQTIGMIYLLLGGPIGWIDWWELAVGPVMVGVFGIGGVLLGSRIRHSILASVALVGIAFAQLIASPDAQVFSPEPGPTASVEWLAPWMIPSNFESVEGLISRPSELHLIYLLLLGGLMASLSTRAPGLGNRLAKLSSAGVISIAVVAVSINMAGELPIRFDWQAAAESQVCETHDGVEYCAFNLYEPWIQRWQHTVEAVDAILPVALSRVVQRPSNTWIDEPGALEEPGLIISITEWDRDGTLPSQEFNLALLAAHSSVGLPLTKQSREWTDAEIDAMVQDNPDYPGDLRAQLESEPGSPRFCSAFRQARAVVAVWLAATALERGEAALASQLADGPIRRIFWIPIDAINGSAPTLIEGVDAQLALQLLGLPTANVVDLLNDRWVEVIDPTTRSTELAGWFGLTRMSAPDTGAQTDEPCA